MDTATWASRARRQSELLGQTVVVIGGSAGIGLETARRARAEGAGVILTARNPARVEIIAEERCRQRRVDETRGDEIDPDRREVEGEAGDSDSTHRNMKPTGPLNAHIMINETLTSATYEIDGGQQLVAG